MSAIAADSLTLLRLPSAVSAGLTVLLTGLLARELGGGRRAEAIAAACAAVGVIVLFTGHLLSTSTFDLLVWTAVTWLVVRAARTANDRLWPIAGAVLGMGLLNKPLPAFLALGLLAGVALAGPRRLLRNPYLVGRGDRAPALVAVAPLAGRARLAPDRRLALDRPRRLDELGAVVGDPAVPAAADQPTPGTGLDRRPGEAVSRSRGARLPVPGMGLDRARRRVHGDGWRPYYLAGLLPALIGAGAPASTPGSAAAGSGAQGALAAAVLASGLIGATISLPLLPAEDAEPVIAVNDDVGETIGWPEFARIVADVHRGLPSPAEAVILTRNYGEAGAIDRYGPDLDLPPAYSGHNAYGDWGRPERQRSRHSDRPARSDGASARMQGGGPDRQPGGHRERGAGRARDGLPRAWTRVVTSAVAAAAHLG